MTNRSLSLMLALTPGIAGQTVTRIMARNALLNRSAKDFLNLSQETLREEYRLAGKVAELLFVDREGCINRAQEMEQRLSALGVLWVTAADAHYPRMVEEMNPKPPGFLFLYGNTKLLESKTFCVLASRNTRPAELNQIEKLAEEGVLKAEVLVTSDDRPEYQRSAIVPLRWGAPRILCLDRGLFQVLGPDLKQEAFPAARLWRYEFDPRTDLAISPFHPNAHHIGLHNQERDKLVGCLSHRLDFVNVTEKGTMDQVLRLALKASRAVRISDTCLGWRQYVQMGATALP